MLSHDANKIMPTVSLQMTSEKIYLGWDSVEALVQLVQMQMINNFYIPQRIVAVGRGAMVPVRILAREKDVPVFYWGLKSYNKEDVFEEVKEYQPLQGWLDNVEADQGFNHNSTLFVDDLTDSGETMLFVQKKYPLAMRAALMSKNTRLDLLDYCGLELPTKRWVVFPWE